MPISETGLRWPPSGGVRHHGKRQQSNAEGQIRRRALRLRHCKRQSQSFRHRTSPDYATAPLPDYDGRPDAAPEALVEGQIMGTFVQEMEASALAQYLLDVQEDLDLYAANTIVHPGWL